MSEFFIDSFQALYYYAYVQVWLKIANLRQQCVCKNDKYKVIFSYFFKHKVK